MFTGARLFLGSLDAAIFWFSRLTGIPEGSAVVPVVAWNERVTISARLADGSTIVGQDAISHPPHISEGGGGTGVAVGVGSGSGSGGIEGGGGAVGGMDAAVAKAISPRISTIVDKSTTGKQPLPARVKDLGYVNGMGQAVTPPVNAMVLERLKGAE